MPEDNEEKVEPKFIGPEVEPKSETHTFSETASVSVTVSPPETSEENPDEDYDDDELIASKEDVDGCIDAIRELTIIMGEVNAKVDGIIVTLSAGKF